MVGDGINDAPAISAASVGVAVSSSPTEMAGLTADIIVLNPQGLAALPWLMLVATRTQQVVHQVRRLCPTLPPAVLVR
jgi:P-type E1-E2 ATPase